MGMYSVGNSLEQTLTVAAMAYLENYKGAISANDREALDVVEGIAVRTKHAGLVEIVVGARRRIRKDQIVVRRRDRINDIVLAKMEGDAAAADAALRALDADDAELVKIATEEAAAKKSKNGGHQ